MTTKVEVTKVEEQMNSRLLFSIRAYTPEGRIEFPIGIQDLGSHALDEIAVLRSALSFADDLAVSIRQRLEPQSRGPYRRICAAPLRHLLHGKATALAAQRQEAHARRIGNSLMASALPAGSADREMRLDGFRRLAVYREDVLRAGGKGDDDIHLRAQSHEAAGDRPRRRGEGQIAVWSSWDVHEQI